MFDPTLAFVVCPACDADARYVQHVTRDRWACNACGHEFSGPSSRTGTDDTSIFGKTRRRTREYSL